LLVTEFPQSAAARQVDERRRMTQQQLSPKASKPRPASPAPQEKSKKASESAVDAIDTAAH
jgi:hypothetical protein